jgi:hypothetical protein
MGCSERILETPSTRDGRQEKLLGQKKTKRIEQKVAKEAKGRSRRGFNVWALFVI